MRGSKCLALAVSVIAAGASQIAAAQSAPEASPSTGGALEEIVVTAQKREQRLQDVPLAIAAFSRDGIASRGIRTSDELTVAVPSLNWQRNLNAAPYIRGIGSRITTAGNQNSVPIYVDSVLQISPLQGNFNLDDIERVEVLKGPQGTLFGRNANGGVISVFTREPSHDASGDFKLGYGNYNTLESSFFGTGGISDTVAGSISLNYRDQAEGWGKNIYNGEEVYKEDSYDIRGKLRMDVGEDTDITLTGSYSYLNSEASANSILEGTRGLDGSGSPGFYNLNSDFHTYIKTKSTIGSLRINHEMGFAKLVSISAYTDVQTDWPFDSDATPSLTLQGPIWENADGFTQEFQLVSNATGPLKWIVGLFYLDSSASFDPIRLFGSVVGGAKVEVYGQEDAQSTAVFGEVTYAFTPQTNLTVGGRMTWDDRKVDGHTDVNNATVAANKQSADFSEPTYRITLDTRPTDGVMLYGTISSGYNSGQFNTGNAFAPAVKPETIQAYEVGFKSEFADRSVQFNGAIYYYDYTDLQVTITQDAVTLQTNAASAEVKGLELEANWMPIEGLTTGINYSYTDATYSEYKDAQVYEPLPDGGYGATVADVTGNNLILSPENSVSVFAQYAIERDFGTFTPSINYNYRSSFFWNYQNDYEEPSHNLVNASVNYEAPSKKWSLQLWGKNLLDEEIRGAGLSRNEGYMSAPSAPLTFGLTAWMHF